MARDAKHDSLGLARDQEALDMIARLTRYRPSIWQRLACWVLEWAERLYLHAHYWDRRNGKYYPPESYRFQRHHPSYRRSHAVNAQKQITYNPMHGGTRKDPDFRDERPGDE